MSVGSLNLLTCKDFLQNLSDYLDDLVDVRVRHAMKRHVEECPNCWLIMETTIKTIEMYRRMDPAPLPEDLRKKIREALERWMLHLKKHA
jgi:hypothetical protein